MRFDHVGILVDDLDAACHFAQHILDLGEPTSIRVDEFSLSAAFFDLGGKGRLELLRFDNPGDRQPGIDHFAVEVDDLELEQQRLGVQGVRFTGPLSPSEVSGLVDMRGRRHLWTIPASSLGFRMQLTERDE